MKYLLRNLFSAVLVLYLFVVSAHAYRDLETGTFITADPAGFVDGPNLYTFVKQNPWTSFDPEGLETIKDYEKQKQAAAKTRDAAVAQAAKNYKPDSKEYKQAVTSAEEAYSKAVKAADKAIGNIEKTAKMWNEAAGYDVVNVKKLNDTSEIYKTLIRNDDILNPEIISAFSYLTGKSEQAFLKTIGVERAVPVNGGATFTDTLGKIWNAPNTALGLVVAVPEVLTGANVSLGNNAIQIENSKLMFLGDITIGNTIHYKGAFGPALAGAHEKKHTPQGQQLGPLYVPSNILGLGAGWILNGDFHGRANWNERGPMSMPPRSW